MTIIRTDNLTKLYGDQKAVNSVSVSVEKGQIFALLGANGSGKSTLVNMLIGLLKPTSGGAIVLGESILDENLRLKKKIGVLPESLALFDGLSIWEHINLTGEVYELTVEQTKYRGEQILKYLDLWETRATRVNECSYGMKKKCALAIALLHNPEVIFLDEPFEGVDPISSKNIQDAIFQASRRDRTFFITSHNLEIIEKIADVFAIISEGEIVCQIDIESLRLEDKSLADFYFENVSNDLARDLEWLGQ